MLQFLLLLLELLCASGQGKESRCLRPPDPALPEPSGFYPLTSATAANDSSLYKNPPGVINNAYPVLGVCGENGGSYNFTGSRSHPSYIKLPKSEFLDTRYSITIVAWVYPEENDGEIASYWQRSNYGVGIFLNNLRPAFHLNSRDKKTKNIFTSKTKLQLNSWNHVAGSYDHHSGNLTIYVNGIPEFFNGLISELQTEYDLWLGYLFKGRLTHILVFNISFSKDEIDKSRSVVKLTPLKCYYCDGTKDECSSKKLSSNNQIQQVCSTENESCIWLHVKFNRSQQMVSMGCATPSFCDNITKNCKEFESTFETGCCDGVCCDSDLCNKGGKFCRRKPELVAIIDGGVDVVRGLDEHFVLNASLSYDPDVGPGNHTGISFTWHWGTITGNSSNNKVFFVTLKHTSIDYEEILYGKNVTVNITNVNKTYVAKLVVAKDHRNATVFQIIRVVKGSPPQVSQRCLINCKPKISPSAKLSVESHCQGKGCVNIHSYEWRIYEQTYDESNDIKWRKREDFQQIASTPLNSSAVVIKENSLVGGKKYRLGLYVQTQDDISGSSVYEIVTASPPTGGECSISPSSGVSLMTNFKLSCNSWISDDTPLTYKFQYQLENGLYSVIYYGQNNSVISWLPAGNKSDNNTLKFDVSVTDRYGVSAPPVHLVVQVKPSGLSITKNFTSFLTAQDSLFNRLIRNGDLNKATQLANTLLEAIAKDSPLSLAKKTKINEFIIRNIVSLNVKSIPELLQVSSVIGSAIQDTDAVSVKSLDLSVSSINNLSSLLWDNAKMKDVATVPLIIQSAENLGSCLNSALKAGGNVASKTYGSGPQQQGQNLVKSSMEIMGVTGNAVLALKVPDEEPTSINTRDLTMTLGRFAPAKVAGLIVSGADGKLVLPSNDEVLQSITHGTRFVDAQMLSIPFNPFSWDATRNRVDSDIISLDLKDHARQLIEVSNLTKDVVISMPLKPQKVSLEIPQYFTGKDNLRFHQINVEYENTLIILEIKPEEKSTTLFVYLRFRNRPTIEVHDINATISKEETCIWTTAHDSIRAKRQCFSHGREVVPIKALAMQPGRYFLGVQNYNSSSSSHIRRKRSCFGNRRQKRSCVEVKDPPPTPPRRKNVSVVPNYDPNVDKNYTLRVALGSCVYWSEREEKWTTAGCRVLSATLNGFINCACNHLTSFGGSLIVKPNPIDFDRVVVEVMLLHDTGNIAVIVTVSMIFLLYLIVFVVARKADKRDQKNNCPPVELPSASNNLNEYEIFITTGVWGGSGTTANVAMEIYGADESTGIIQLGGVGQEPENTIFARGNTDTFVIKVDKQLGDIQSVRIGHDNSGNSPSWLLEEIVIVDKQTNHSWMFTVSEWLALERGDGRTERLLRLTSYQEDFNTEVLKRWWKGLIENHIWVSVIMKARRNRFTRVQRASCCLSVLLTAMLANAMFYRLDGKSELVIQIGPLKFSWKQVIIGIESALIVAPINISIAFLFRKGAQCDAIWRCKLKGLTYLAWFLWLCACAVSATFTTFYSLVWGSGISEQWLSSMFISFVQDLAVTEPVKVFFTAVLLAAIVRRKRFKPRGYAALKQTKLNLPNGRLWKLNLAELEEMRRQQARKQNISRFFVELFVYLIFVFLLLVVCYGNRNNHRYMMAKSIKDGIPAFEKVSNDTKFWNWLVNVFLPGVFAGKWYNNQKENHAMYIGDKRSVLVGMPRARQLRVESKPCELLDYMKNFPECYGELSRASESTSPFNRPGWKPVDNSTKSDELFQLCPKPWRYQKPEENDGVPKWGQFSFYPWGGFVADLGYENATGFGIIKQLQKDSWLDRQTRVVILEFATFNPSTSLLFIGTYFFETEISGYKSPITRSAVISLDSTETASQHFYLVCVLLFMIFVFLYTGRECYRLNKRRSRYFKSFWSWVEIFQVIFSVLAVVIYIVRSKSAVTTIQKLKQNIYANVNFQDVVIFLEVENAVLGILTFIVTAKLLRLIRFNKHVIVFSRTVRTSARFLTSYSVIFFIGSIAFLHFGVLVFGPGSAHYSSVLRATYFQLELTLGRVKARSINELADANETFGRIFSSLLLLSLTVIGMNFFISMMNDALMKAKAANYENELFDLVDESKSMAENPKHVELFNVVSKTMSQVKTEQKVDKDHLNKSNGNYNKRLVDFDVISAAISASRRQNVETLERESEVIARSTRRKSLFERVSCAIRRLKIGQGGIKNKERRKPFSKKQKVRFAEELIKSHLKNLKRHKKLLFKGFEDILLGHDEEEKKFLLLCYEMVCFSARADAKHIE
ncbi:polycystin-1-like protein 2 [Acropora muricata]|uniref:polycystin-1-like protein 2 n=1 Tax=Acropora muricata TaxID=159855 RepID=UPI0034E4B3B8